MSKLLNTLAAATLALTPMACSEEQQLDTSAEVSNPALSELSNFKNDIRALIQRTSDLFASLSPDQEIPNAAAQEACALSLEIQATILAFLQNTNWDYPAEPHNDFLAGALTPNGIIPPEEVGYTLSAVLVPEGLPQEDADRMQGMQCEYIDTTPDNSFQVYYSHFNDFHRPGLDVTTVHSPDFDPTQGAQGFFQQFEFSDGDSPDITVAFYYDAENEGRIGPRILIALDQTALDMSCGELFTSQDLFDATKSHSSFVTETTENFPKLDN